MTIAGRVVIAGLGVSVRAASVKAAAKARRLSLLRRSSPATTNKLFPGAGRGLVLETTKAPRAIAGPFVLSISAANWNGRIALRIWRSDVGTIETYAKPITIYRYRRLAPERNQRAVPSLISQEVLPLEKNYIFCPKYTQMNDPMEGLYKASRRVQSRDDYQDFTDLVRSQKLQLGIASFSETWDNELMWAHYGGGFAGICIAYSVTKLLAGLANDCALARVAYGESPYYLGLGAMRQDDRARAILSTKNLKWSYEREWRLFAPTNGQVSYNTVPVTCVYLGPRMSKADQKRLQTRLERAGIEARCTEVDGYSIKRAT